MFRWKVCVMVPIVVDQDILGMKHWTYGTYQGPRGHRTLHGFSLLLNLLRLKWRQEPIGVVA